MNIRDIPVPEVYKESADFRFFLKWFELALSRIKYDIEHFFDLYDPLRCPEQLLWMLADTMGFKLDDRLPTAFNRLVLLYFMSMIRHKGSKDGVTLAAEVNLAQFNILMQAGQGYTDADGNPVPPNEALYNRLEDTSIPVNSVYVTPHTDAGYIDVVYFSEKKPVDACIEYVRPLGMYLFQHAGVRYDARSKISIDARLTDSNNLGMSIGPTHVGHYSRDDYARLQGMSSESTRTPNAADARNPVYYRNSKAEVTPDASINPGFRSLYSLQLANNAHITRSLLGPIFDLGYDPQDVGVQKPVDYVKHPYKYNWNLRYNQTQDQRYDRPQDLRTIDENRSGSVTNPRPAVNTVMATMGDAISANADNTRYTDTVGGTPDTVDPTDA